MGSPKFQCLRGADAPVQVAAAVPRAGPDAKAGCPADSGARERARSTQAACERVSASCRRLPRVPGPLHGTRLLAA